MSDNLLIIFVKNPEPGQVKSRLASTHGDHEAARVYKAITEELISAVDPSSKGSGYDMAIAYSPADAAKDIQAWLGSGIQLLPQSGDNLGERMHKAFQDGFALGYKKILIIGSDCPAVTHALIIETLHKLDRHDVVIGPATDGGYYLIGLCSSAPGLFTGIGWSTKLALQQTIERCNALHLTYVLLPELRDIDRIEDLEFYRRQGLNV